MTSKTEIRRFLESVATMRSEVEDLKQERPTDAAPTITRSLSEVGVAVGDELTYETTADPVFTYGDAERGYGRGEWGAPDPATAGYDGTVPGFGSNFGFEFGVGEEMDPAGYGEGGYGSGGYGE
jgi:hypothetical protein